jgi:predicted metal-dependent hydrolase
MIPYIIKKSARARNIRITIKTDATVVVTVPARVSISVAEKFVSSKEEWIQEKVTKTQKHLAVQIVPKASARDYKQNKDEALTFALQKLARWNTFYNLKWNTVTARNTSSRWGSCSKRGNLSFNYRIIYLPEELADYLIVHELCHLKELNHSQNFWKLIEETIPNYRQTRGELRKIL